MKYSSSEWLEMDLSWFVNTRAIDTEDMERKPNRVKTRAGL